MMNEEWKKKYNFDEKTRVTESSMPNSMPCNISPFIKRDDFKESAESKVGNKAKPRKKKEKESCVIS